MGILEGHQLSGLNKEALGSPREAGKTLAPVDQLGFSLGLPGLLRTSLFRICSSDSCTSMRGRTVVKSFHQGQSFTPLFFLMFFCTQRMARSWI